METKIKVEKLIIRTVDGKVYECKNATVLGDEKNGWLGVKDDERVMIFVQNNIIVAECRGKMEVNNEETN